LLPIERKRKYKKLRKVLKRKLRLRNQLRIHKMFLHKITQEEFSLIQTLRSK